MDKSIIPTADRQDCAAKYRGLYDKDGTPIDKDGNAIGWGERDGHMFLINGERLVVKQLFIEVPIPSQAVPVNNYNFADQPLLRNTSLWGLEFYTASSIPYSPVSGTAMVTDTMLGYMFLWMQTYAGSYNFFQNKPCVTLRTMALAVTGPYQPASPLAAAQTVPYRTFPEGLSGQHVNWPNCYISFVKPTTAIAASTPYAIGVDVYYSLYNNWQMDGFGSTFGLR